MEISQLDCTLTESVKTVCLYKVLQLSPSNSFWTRERIPLVKTPVDHIFLSVLHTICPNLIGRVRMVSWYSLLSRLLTFPCLLVSNNLTSKLTIQRISILSVLIPLWAVNMLYPFEHTLITSCKLVKPTTFKVCIIC